MALTFIDPSISTGTMAGYLIGGSEGLVTWDATELALKCDSGASGGGSAVFQETHLGAAFTVAFTATFPVLPDANAAFWDWYSAGYAGLGHYLRLFSDGALSVNDAYFSAVGVIQAGVEYEFVIVGSVTSGTVNQIKVWVNETLVFDHSNITIGGTLPAINVVGWETNQAMGANRLLYLKHLVLANDNNGMAYRKIRTTRKRPAALSTNTFATGIGSGTNRWDRVNERPISLTNGWQSGAAAQEETYTLEASTAGDVNLTGATIIGNLGWIWADRTTGTNRTTTHFANGTGVTVTLNIDVPTYYGQIFTSATYPSGKYGLSRITGTGMTARLYETGAVIAYTPAPTKAPPPRRRAYRNIYRRVMV